MILGDSIDIDQTIQMHIFFGVTHCHCLFQQAKFFQVRGRVLEVFFSSVGHVIWQIKFFYILYYFIGKLFLCLQILLLWDLMRTVLVTQC